MKALALKHGRKTIEVSLRGAGYLWSLAARHYTGRQIIGVVYEDQRRHLKADGWAVVPVEFKEIPETTTPRK